MLRASPVPTAALDTMAQFASVYNGGGFTAKVVSAFRNLHERLTAEGRYRVQAKIKDFKAYVPED
eukprot:gene1552-2883_t